MATIKLKNYTVNPNNSARIYVRPGYRRDNKENLGKMTQGRVYVRQHNQDKLTKIGAILEGVDIAISKNKVASIVKIIDEKTTANNLYKK